jgi:tRNA pseudouridine32 synthase/23S rRNA pseudouridine746 synthase
MLQGLEVDENPLLNPVHEEEELEIVFEDEWLLVVNKPAGMLSVPGKAEDRDSVYHRLKKKYPEATGPMIVHRLDMATSGLLLVAKTKEVHQDLQAQFANRSIKKRYVAVLDGAIIKTEKETKPIAEKAILLAKETVSTKKTAKAERTGNTGRIELPLCLNPLDRPRQMVSSEHGKEAITEYQIISESERITSESENTFNESNRIDESERSINESRKYTRIVFYPLTGRTHQLRVHAAHPEGLGCPILGDELYGKKADRLYLHAEYIEFRHPIYGDILCIQKEADFHKNMIKP